MTVGKFIFFFALAAAAVYAGITAHPAVFFEPGYVYKNITVYTHEALGETPASLLSAVYDKISAGEFYDAGQNFEIYLAGSYLEYAFLAPFCRNRYACAHPLSDKVFVASSDIGSNAAYPPRSRGGPVWRDLGRVIVHELVKVQLKRKLGALTYFTQPDWKKEGYAEHVAMETRDMNPADFCQGASLPDPALPFLENRLIVEMVSLEDQIGYPALMAGNYNYDSVRSRIEQRHCGRRL